MIVHVKRTIDGKKFCISVDQLKLLRKITIYKSWVEENNSPEAKLGARLRGLVKQGLMEETRLGWRLTAPGRRFLKKVDETK